LGYHLDVRNRSTRRTDGGESTLGEAGREHQSAEDADRARPVWAAARLASHRKSTGSRSWLQQDNASIAHDLPEFLFYCVGQINARHALTFLEGPYFAMGVIARQGNVSRKKGMDLRTAIFWDLPWQIPRQTADHELSNPMLGKFKNHVPRLRVLAPIH
jgi:hypothetical protein